MITLGIESSCDETAVAIINDKHNILGHKLITQYTEHSKYGGVVPEIASRAHLEYVDTLINQALYEASLSPSSIDVYSAGLGPGLIGGLIVGATIAKSMAFTLEKPFISVNHLEAHALMPMFFDEELNFPYLLLLLSGGHSQILVVKGVGNYDLLGTTLDDACGECFDKVAKMLGWNYMGGSEIEKFAELGNKDEFNFPRPLVTLGNLNFSFSGLKTAVRIVIEKIGNNITNQIKADICASFQSAVCDVIEFKINQALKKIKNLNINHIVVSGGVASNSSIKNVLLKVSNKNNMNFSVASPKYCTDNGVMIAYAGEQNFLLRRRSNFDAIPKPRWPLEDLKYE